jgi:hypothetical protein
VETLSQKEEASRRFFADASFTVVMVFGARSDGDD